MIWKIDFIFQSKKKAKKKIKIIVIFNFLKIITESPVDARASFAGFSSVSPKSGSAPATPMTSRASTSAVSGLFF